MGFYFSHAIGKEMPVVLNRQLFNFLNYLSEQGYVYTT